MTNTGQLKKYVKPDDDRILETAFGWAIYTDRKSGIDYLRDVKEYELKDSDIAKQFEVAYKLYKFETIVAAAIDVMIEFGATRAVIESESDEYQTVFNYWLDKINVDNDNIDTGMLACFIQWLFNWFVFGNTIPKWVYENTEVDGKKYKLPMILSYYDPRDIEISDAMTFTRKTVYYKVPQSILNIVNKIGKLLPEEKELLDSIDPELRKEIKKSSKIPLNRDYFKHFKRKSPPYEKFGLPYVLKAIPAVADLKRLQALDSNTIDGFINNITIFKIGNLEYPATVNKRRLSQFAALLQNPTPNLNLVWTPDVEIEDTRPPGDILNIGDRYKQAAENIFDSLNVPVHFISGRFDIPGETLYGSSLSLMEKLEKPRSLFITFLEELKDQIYEINKFDVNKKTYVNLTNLNMKNPRYVENLIRTAYEKGLISIQTTLQNVDQKIEIERIRREREKRDGLQDTFYPPPNPATTPGTPQGEMPTDEPKEEVEPEEEPKTEEQETPKESAEESININTKAILTYKAIANNLFDKKKKKKLNKNFIEQAVLSGLKKIESLISKDFYNLVEGGTLKGSKFEEDFTFGKLASWSMRTLGIGAKPSGIYMELSKTLSSALHHRMTDEAFMIVAKSILDSYESKISSYVITSLLHANLVYDILCAKADGKTEVKIHSEDDCEFCQKLDRNIIPIDGLFDLKVHMGCKCKFEYK